MDTFETSFPVFPETIFVKQEDDGEDGQFLIASEDPSDMAERGVAVPTAEYRLVRVGNVIEMTKFV